MNHWHSDAIHYQVNLRSIAAAAPRTPFEAYAELETEPVKGPSPLAALASGVGRLKQFGVTQIHIMPPFLMGREARKGIGSPYAIADYYQIDPEFGTLDDLAHFVRAAHQEGLRVILGMVPNHTSRDHVWTSQSPAFFVRAHDGTPAYDADWSDTAKLDYHQPALRSAMKHVYLYWLNFPEEGRGVDGFRIDMAHFINDRSFWDEALPVLRASQPHRDILFLAECYGFENNLDLFRRGFDAAYDDDLYKCWQYFFTADAHQRSRSFHSPDAARNGDFVPWLEAWHRDGIAGAVRAIVQGYQDASAFLPRPISLARYTDNHDEGRGIYRFGEDAVRAFHRLISLLPQTMPFFLSGQEFGALNRPPIHEYFGLCDKGYVSRHTVHEVHYAAGLEWEGNVFARTAHDRRAWHDFYRELIAFRTCEPTLRHGAIRWVAGQTRNLLCFDRIWEGRTLRCAVNLGSALEPLPEHLHQGSALLGSTGQQLGAWQAVVVEG